MAVDSLGEILRRVSPHVYIVQEVIYGRGEPITPAQCELKHALTKSWLKVPAQINI